ncbi:MAG: serine/threonine protein kinase, partial [Gammaproteobacteria bacterium]|nr:serine/threonine protein kinase [Gammaproteobacteria bacterium]
SRSRLKHDTLIELVNDVLETQDAASEKSQTKVPENSLDIPGLKGYQIERCISGGDIASVYLAKETASGRSVVLKVLRQVPDFGGGEALLDRFLAEFEAIGRISHPNVVNIYDLGIADNHAYIAMEYCSRGSLKRLIRQGMYPQDADKIMRQIGEALGAIHGVGILHRDLKPTNVLFREDGSLALIDFGLAKQAHLKSELTGTGEIFGTPYYMSPEQGHGEPLDERSDIYSLGVILYEMLSGKKPYDGNTAMAVILQHAREPVPKLPEHASAWQPAIDKMMAKRPGHRFQSVAELLAWQPATV